MNNVPIYIPNKKNISSSSAKKCPHQQKTAISTTQIVCVVRLFLLHRRTDLENDK